jgi:hypothetical protein
MLGNNMRKSRPGPKHEFLRNKFGVTPHYGADANREGPPARLSVRSLTPGQSITRDEAVNFVAHMVFFGHLESEEIMATMREVAKANGQELPAAVPTVVEGEIESELPSAPAPVRKPVVAAQPGG